VVIDNVDQPAFLTEEPDIRLPDLNNSKMIVTIE